MSESPDSPVRVLIVDDDEAHAETLADALELSGYACRVASSGEDAVQAMGAEVFEVILTDLVMRDISGLEVLKEARVLLPEAAVLLVTGHASWETARDAIQQGAETYLSKPVDLGELRAMLGKVVEKVRLRRANQELLIQNADLRRQIDERFGFEDILGHSPQMHRVFEILGQVSGADATVLILGESGTGKELVARAIHTNSRRAEKPFVAVNCAALSEGLIESELFGHMKGAFTGATTEKVGRIAFADGGTLFLDEVGDMPLTTQAKLLRVLETREVMPVGGNVHKKVDIRLLAATNQDLHQMTRDSTFREDLLFRLQVVTVELPPLRDRAGDLPLLIEHFIGELAVHHGRPITGITPEARALLVRYGWPGNVRELRNAIENMVLLARDEVLTVDDVPELIKGGGGPSSALGYDLAGRSLEEVERELIRTNLDLMEGNRQRTAQVLGMGERTLYRKIKLYGLG